MPLRIWKQAIFLYFFIVFKAIALQGAILTWNYCLILCENCKLAVSVLDYFVVFVDLKGPNLHIGVHTPENNEAALELFHYYCQFV